MTITSLPFVLFALVSIVVINLAGLLPWKAARAGAILACNLFFLASFATKGPVQLLPLGVFIVLGWVAAMVLRRTPTSQAFWCLVALILLTFFWLKRYIFVPGAWLLPYAYVTIGMSYILFRILQVVIDTRDGLLIERPEPIGYLNYLLIFPAFISGPIQRYQDWTRQQNEPLRLGWDGLGVAVERIVLGAFKVIVLAPIFLAWQKDALGALAATQITWDRGFHGLVITGAYAVYLYFNFSGYTDIVVGIARLFGLELPENFNRPFAAASFLDFWARWHMSLSDWLKTYVYSPVVKYLMQRFPSRSVEPYIGVCAFFVTFFLIGLWHGQTAVFALYGFLLGVGVSANKLYQIRMAKRLGRKRYGELSRRTSYQALGRGLTFCWFALSLVCFWAPWDQLTRLCADLGPAGFATSTALLVVVAGAVFTALDLMRSVALRVRIRDVVLLESRYVRTVIVTTLVVVTAATIGLTSGPAPDIVYKNF